MQPGHILLSACAVRHQISFPVMLFSLGVLLAGAPSEAAHFRCPAADVTCLISAINQANANGQDNTIALAAGAYTLTAVDNDTDGANGLPSVTGTLTIRGAGADLTSISRNEAPETPPIPVASRLAGRRAHGTRSDADEGCGDRTHRREGARERSGNPGARLGRRSATASSRRTAVRLDDGHRPNFGGGVAGGTVVITHSTINGNHAHSGWRRHSYFSPAEPSRSAIA